MTEEGGIIWFAGLDWGSETHRVALFDDTGQARGLRDVSHDANAYAELCAWLTETAGQPAGRIGIAIETTHGPVVEMLLERGFQVFGINPRQLDRFRDRYSVSGAKDDTRDAQTLGRSLRTDRDAFRPLSLDNPVLVRLREATRMYEEMSAERVRLTSRFRDQLWRYYPQMLKLTDNLADVWLLALWQLAPTPAKGARLHKTTIARLLASHRIRRLDADQVRSILREAPLVVAPGVTEAARAHIGTLVVRLRLINNQIKAVGQEIDVLTAALAGPPTIEPGESVPGQTAEQRDVAILRSLPGLGRIGHATLLAEAHGLLQARDYQALRALSGVAPVTQRSGKSCLVVRRLAHNHRLARAMFHWARVAAIIDPVSKARYAALRARGHRHARALRGIGDRLLALACALLRDQVLFDPKHGTRGRGASSA